MVSAVEAEQLIYRWCTEEARGTRSAQALATLYVSSFLDGTRLLRLADLNCLDDTRLDWALALIRGYVEKKLALPWARAMALVALYEIDPDEGDVC